MLTTLKSKRQFLKTKNVYKRVREMQKTFKGKRKLNSNSKIFSYNK